MLIIVMEQGLVVTGSIDSIAEGQQIRFKNRIVCSAVSDDLRIAMGFDGGRVIIVNAKTMDMERLQVHREFVEHTSFSSTGQLLTADTKTTKLWSPNYKLEGEVSSDSPIQGIAWLENAFMVAEYSGRIRVHSASDLSLLAVVEIEYEIQRLLQSRDRTTIVIEGILNGESVAVFLNSFAEFIGSTRIRGTCSSISKDGSVTTVIDGNRVSLVTHTGMVTNVLSLGTTKSVIFTSHANNIVLVSGNRFIYRRLCGCKRDVYTDMSYPILQIYEV
jgi:hypothetical protein